MAKQKFDVIIEPYEAIEVMVRDGEQIQDWGHKLLEADKAYVKTRGDGVIIFILDTAGEFVHPDLADREIVSLRKNFSTSQNFTDVHGHGTHCAGIAAASDNSIGVIGIAPRSNLAAVKVLSDQGSGAFTGISQGVRYVADVPLSGPYAGFKKIISMSLGASSGSQELRDAINYAISKGVFVVAAAGNPGNQNPVNYPGAYEEVITVASIGKTVNPSPFTPSGTQIDVAAPGEGVFSTHKNGGYAYLSGTSMATPQVAGLCALILSYHKNITSQAHLEKFLEDNAKDIYLPGEDLLTGAGLPMIVPYLDKAPGDGPIDPPPPPPPPVDPPFQREKRAVVMPIYFDNVSVVWRRQNQTALKKAFIFNVTFIVTTRNETEADFDKFKSEFISYATNRGYILPNTNDLQDVAEWVARFFRIIKTGIGEYEIESITVMDESERMAEVRADKLKAKIGAQGLVSRYPVSTFTIDEIEE